MNETDAKERQRFQQAADRRLHCLTGDPWLAKRIINGEIGEKKEKKMKKKMSLGLVLAAVLVSVLAFALAENWQEVQGALTQKDLVTLQPPRQAVQIPEGEHDPDPDEWVSARITDYAINGSFMNATLEITSLREDFALYEELELVSVETFGEDTPLDEKTLDVNGEITTIAKWRQGRTLVESYLTLESEAPIPGNLSWYYHTTHELAGKADRLIIRVAFLDGLEPGMFTEDKPLCLLLRMQNTDTEEKQNVSLPLPSLPESADEGTVPPLPGPVTPPPMPDATLTPEQAMEMALALEADQEADGMTPAPAAPTPMPDATLTPDQSNEMALALEADGMTPAQTVALHRWLYERAVENAEAVGTLAKSDAYLETVGLTAQKYQGKKGFRAQDYSSPTVMRLYTLNPEHENASVSPEENPFVLSQIRRYLSLEGASIGNRGENAASETIRPAAFLTVTTAYSQPGGLSDTVVVLDFDGDYSVCCVFTAFADGCVLCDAGMILSDLPGGLFVRTGTYEGVALQLLNGN